MGQRWERSLTGWSRHGNLSRGCSQEISQSCSLWRLEDLILRWLMHMVGKLVLAIGRKSQFFLMCTLSQSNLTVLMTWRWASSRVSPQRKSKKEAAEPFMTKPWKSTLVPQCSIGYTDQLYSRRKGLHWGMCIRRQHSLGPSWGLATTITHSPARTVLPPDVSKTHTLITSRSLLKSYFTGEACPKLSLRMESLSPFSLLLCFFIFPYCT